jgi:CheY-like chemotaxis protein
MTAKILIVDDEQFVRDLLEKVLKRRGHDVVAAGDADQALVALEQAHFDLLLTDVVMPGMDGFDLLRRVKSAYPEIKVIVLTGYARKQSISDFLLYGADDYLSKPFQVHELVAAVERVTGTPARA